MAVFEKCAELNVSTESVGGDCLEAMLSEPCADLPSVVTAPTTQFDPLEHQV